MSKTIFLLSRCMLAAPGRRGNSIEQVIRSYKRCVKELGAGAPFDDFDFLTTLRECDSHLPGVLAAVDRVSELCAGTDSLGLTFNTLLRGKWESGEGLGTHLTPEEVVSPMVKMVLGSIRRRSLLKAKSVEPPLYFGDPCGGTGRFVFHFAKELRKIGFDSSRMNSVVRLYDQSSFSVDLARINFAFDGCSPALMQVPDSLTARELSDEAGRYLAIATNPPFGSGKYAWSEDLTRALGAKILNAIGIGRSGNVCDPAELFVFRCLDLLAIGGVLAIVLPDGVIHARRFKQTLELYENLNRRCSLELLAIVSLPTVTFALGGTVAKTSFLLIRKGTRSQDIPLYVAKCKHIGFKKRGNRRAEDPRGNDLLGISDDYLERKEECGQWVSDWREVDRLMPMMLLHKSTTGPGCRGTPLSSMARIEQTRGQRVESDQRPWYHVSVVDVDDTGLIDVNAASRNRPVTPPLACEEGDVLVSCLNPSIWRVTVIPDLEGDWTCSAEFAVLRPHNDIDPWALALRLHHRDVIERVVSLASGTSSSRQRVSRESLLKDVLVPEISTDPRALFRFSRDRTAFYRSRADESRAFSRLHDGAVRFYL